MFTNNYLHSNLLINPTSLITYPVFEHQFTKRNKTSFKVVKNKGENLNYKGEVNNKSKSKIIQAVNLLYDISTTRKFKNSTTGKLNYFKLNFITLTLSSAQMQVSDKLIKKECLGWWLNYAKRKFGLVSYVWKSERQKNGNLHFHLTTNCYISVKELRESWNQAQNRIGFLDLFENKFNHRNPNSTDIRIVKSTKMLGVYIAKYIGKELNKKDKISGKVWDCSLNLKNVKKCNVELLGIVEDELEEVLEKNKFVKIDKDYINIFVSKEKRIKEMLVNKLKEEYNGYLSKVKNYKRNSANDPQVVDNRKQIEEERNKKEYKSQVNSFKKNDRLPSTKQYKMLMRSWG
jgi:hypothetical protein